MNYIIIECADGVNVAVPNIKQYAKLLHDWTWFESKLDTWFSFDVSSMFVQLPGAFIVK